jgi:DNA-binding transcriptional MerR regulator/effector-binding domain-containing protein
MFKIGDFSRLTGVSIKTLHHYDSIGLFRPARVDPFTGYRFYIFDQLPRLNRILALRALGFSLEQIGRILGEGDAIGISADELRGMLTLRRAQLQQQVDRGLESLTQVEIRLKQIEQEGKMAEVEVLTKEVQSLSLVGARETVPDPSLMRARCIALNEQAWGAIQAAKLTTDGVSFALYYSSDQAGIDVEMAYRVDGAPTNTTPQPPATIHTLPATTVVYGIYRGSYDDFGAVGRVHGAIAGWIEANGYKVNGPCREFYLRPPMDRPDRTGVMEIQYPVES